MFENKSSCIEHSSKILEDIYDELSRVEVVLLETLETKRTALVIIDMVNGFAREGMLKSDRVEGIIGEIAALCEACKERGIEKIAFGDSHTTSSPEFSSYPEHCLTGTSEAEIVDELKTIGGYKYIAKNSTNGFLEDEFQSWLLENNQIDCFIVTGNCTDICIQQFAITLKTWFNRRNKHCRVIVPINAVETFDLGLHSAELVNLMALFQMKGNGIEIVKCIER